MTFYPLMAKLGNLFKKKLKVKSGKEEQITEIEEYETLEQVNKLFLAVHNQVIDKIKYIPNKRSGSHIIRMLLPKDFGLKNHQWKRITKISGFSIYWTIHYATFIGVWGFHIPKNCKIREIEIWRDGTKLRVWNIERMCGDYFFDDPFTIDENSTFRIKTYPTSAVFNIKFYGNVIEKKGLTIDP